MMYFNRMLYDNKVADRATDSTVPLLQALCLRPRRLLAIVSQLFGQGVPLSVFHPRKRCDHKRTARGC